jgi:hypothetical protein
MKTMKRILFWFLVAVGVIIFLPLILLILFAPLRYAVVARADKNITVRAKASYLFRLITAQYVYSNGTLKSRLKIAGITVSGSRKNKKVQTTNTPEKTRDDTEQNNNEPVETMTPDTQQNNEPTKPPTPDTQQYNNEPLETPTPEKEKSPPPDEKTSTSGFNKLKNILTYPELKTIISLTLKCLKKTTKTLLPKRLDIFGTVGFADPAATGMFIGFYETVAGLLSLRDKIRLYADFAEPGIKAKVSLAGSISIARLLRPVVWLVCKKPIRRFIIFLKG